MADSVPDVSVVMPVWRAEAHVAEAIANVAAQEGVSLELIVVDDDSGDRTAELAAAAVAEAGVDGRMIRLERNDGAAAARNAGIDAARGRYVAFYDVDDRWRAGKLAKQVALLDSDPGLVLVGCDARFAMADGSQEWMLLGTRPGDLRDCGERLFTETVISTPCAVVRREALQGERFDDTLAVAEDRDLWLRLALKGRVGVVPEVLVDVLLSPASLMKREGVARAADGVRMMEANIARWGERLSPELRKRAMGRALFDAGEQMVLAPGYWGKGAAWLLRAAALGFKPGRAVRHALLTAPPVRALRGR